jgi:hypothetical protein
MQNANVKRSPKKLAANGARESRNPVACEGIPEFMIRIARERRMKISVEPTVPKYRHD